MILIWIILAILNTLTLFEDGSLLLEFGGRAFSFCLIGTWGC